MAVQRQSIAPEYLSFYLAGSNKVAIPIPQLKRTIVHTPDCINIPARYWNDGDTHVTLGRQGEISESREPDFDGFLNTPERVVVLFDSNEPEFMRSTVFSKRTRVRIWIDHPTEPDNVTISLG